MKTKLMGILAVCYVTTGWDVTPTYAFPVTWEFTGTVDTFRDTNNLFGGAVSVGTLITTQINFESTTPDIYPDDVHHGWYDNPIISVTGFLGDFPFRWLDSVYTLSYIRIHNNVTDSGEFIDNYIIRYSITFQDIQDIYGQELELDLGVFLRNNDATMFSSDALPLQPIDVDLIPVSSVFDTLVSQGVSFDGRITSIVPEPTTLTLFATGIFALLKRRRVVA